MAQRSDALSTAAVLVLLVGVLATIPTNVQSIGVCYGMLGNNLPSQADVVKLYQSNGITAMRIYAPDGATLTALKGTNINLIMDVAKTDLASFASSSSAAADWVKNNVQAYSDVSFKYIAVGNEVSGSDVSNILPAMKNIYSALSSAGLQDKIKVSTSVSFDVVGTSYPPSAGAFSSSASSYMTSIVQYLATTGAPLLANIYPYFSYAGNTGSISLEYALFTSSGTVVTDGSYQYQNLFDAMVDALYSAMEKAGGSNVGIVISESGWPSASGTSTTASNAQTYNQNLINHVGNGTPKRPGNLETYVFAMFNENQKAGDEVERHFGLFNSDQSPVYSINFN